MKGSCRSRNSILEVQRQHHSIGRGQGPGQEGRQEGRREVGHQGVGRHGHAVHQRIHVRLQLAEVQQVEMTTLIRHILEEEAQVEELHQIHKRMLMLGHMLQIQ